MAPDAERPQLSGDRYRIDSYLSSGTHMTSWRGHDLRLNRAVTIRVIRDDLPDGNGADVKGSVVSHLRRAVRVEDPGLTRIYDTLGPDNVGVVSEPIDGDSLKTRIDEHGPMSLDRSCAIVVELAKTLDAVHQQRITHGGLDATSIGYTSDGRLVISDLGTCGQPEATEDLIAADIFDLAGLLHHLVCGRRPHDSGTNHEIDLSTPADIAGVLTLAFSGKPPWTTALQFGAAVDARSDLDSDEHGEFARAERRWLLPVGAVLIVAVVIGLIGSLIGSGNVARDIIDNARDVVGLDPAPVTTSPPSSTARPVVPPASTVVPFDMEILRITDFDPDGDDNREHPERLVLINDADPTRGWQTQIYTSRDFGRLKDGLGLIVELVDPGRITEVVVRSPTRGWAFELFLADAPPLGIDDWGEPVHTSSDIDSDTVIEIDSIDTASLLIWITDLGDGPQYRATITDIEISGIG